MSHFYGDVYYLIFNLFKLFHKLYQNSSSLIATTWTLMPALILLLRLWVTGMQALGINEHRESGNTPGDSERNFILWASVYTSPSIHFIYRTNSMVLLLRYFVFSDYLALCKIRDQPWGFISLAWGAEAFRSFSLLPISIRTLLTALSISLYHPYLLRTRQAPCDPEKTSSPKDWGLCNTYGHDAWAGIPDCHTLIDLGSRSSLLGMEEASSLALY